jgi:hypothetical protein
VEAAEALGLGRLGILFRHILPNVISPIVIQTAVCLSYGILIESALSDPPPLAPLPGPRRPPVRRAHHPAPARAGTPGARELNHLDGARVAPALPVRRHTSLANQLG